MRICKIIQVLNLQCNMDNTELPFDERNENLRLHLQEINNCTDFIAHLMNDQYAKNHTSATLNHENLVTHGIFNLSNRYPSLSDVRDTTFADLVLSDKDLEEPDVMSYT